MNETCGEFDADLMRRWQEGDAAAFEALVRRWQQPVARVVGRLTDGPEPVQDLCQEVFLRVYLAGGKYRETGAFAIWIFRIALNVARDARRRRRQPEHQLQLDVPAEVGSASAACEQEEIALAVRRVLAALPADEREVLVLRHYQDMSFEAMSRLLGTPSSTLKSRFAAGLRRMRVQLQHLGWSHEETK